ncbi:MAG: carbon starvation CstA family protein, partial [Planctomycetaceae bacterium]
GNVVPAWRVFWVLFGASNQLLAALTLLGVTVWLWRTRRVMWVWFVAGLPTLWMYSISMWGLGTIILRDWQTWLPATPVPYVALVLVVLGGLMLVEAVIVLLRPMPGPPPREKPAFAPTT